MYLFATGVQYCCIKKIQAGWKSVRWSDLHLAFATRKLVLPARREGFLFCSGEDVQAAGRACPHIPDVFAPLPLTDPRKSLFSVSSPVARERATGFSGGGDCSAFAEAIYYVLQTACQLRDSGEIRPGEAGRSGDVPETLELDLVEAPIEGAAGGQLVVRAHVEDPPVLHDHDPVGQREGPSRWVMITAVRSRMNCSSTFWISCSLSRSTWLVASSRMRMAGSRRIARARAIRCRWPPESRPPIGPTSVS